MKAYGENHGTGILGDFQVFLGESDNIGFFEPGQQLGHGRETPGTDTARYRGAQPYFSSVTPTQLHVTIGGYPDTGNHEYTISYNYAAKAAFADPPMSGDKIGYSPTQDMYLPQGLYGQVVIWTGYDGVEVRMNHIRLFIEGIILE